MDNTKERIKRIKKEFPVLDEKFWRWFYSQKKSTQLTLLKAYEDDIEKHKNNE